MTALRKPRIYEPLPLTAVVRAPAAKLYLVTNDDASVATAALPATITSTLKNIVLFFAAPFIGLLYVLAMPFVGLGALAVIATRAALRFEAVRTVARALGGIGMLVAAPFIGLAYVVLFPVGCLGALAWTGGRAFIGTDMR